MTENNPNTELDVNSEQQSINSPTIAVVYHSNYGHTRRVAHSIVSGIVQEGVMARAIDTNELDWDYIDNANMIVFGSAVYLGSVTAEFKQFMDSTSKRWFERAWEGKWAAAFANSGGLSGDKLSVLQQICLFAMQHGMNWTGLPLVPKGYSETDLNRLSSFLGLMTQSDNAPPEQTPPEGDIKTAEWFGMHLAQVVLKG
ncbi:flavodoxin family protein [Psychrobacter sp. HD31]|uniref:flavodoxin family protein n=1 Tax=Psychrobacter sp. HD31 TaxID=3112003 RepID=UPI003DA37A1F